MDRIVMFLTASVGSLGYFGIISLMALESSFFPFPSEVVVPPAGYLAAKGEMNLSVVIVCGIAGSILGALVNYYLAVRMGRTLIIKYGKYFFVSEEKFARMETFFNKHGEITTFVGRLLPGIRQYISFPAGIARMNMGKFIFFTALGSGIWVLILALLGYFIGNNIEMIKSRIKIITIVMIPFLLAIVWLYIQYSRKLKKGEL